MIQGGGKGRYKKSSQKSRGIITCISITRPGLINDCLIMGTKIKSQDFILVTGQSKVLHKYDTRYLSSMGGKKGRRLKKAKTWRAQSTLPVNQDQQDNGKLMQEINLSYNRHVHHQCQGPAHWKSELLKYMISVLFHAHFHATPFGGGHLSSH